jgi:hydrogenase maturation protein HypF
MPLPGYEPFERLRHRARLRLLIRGAVQGVGFRPFIYRLATSQGLVGWVINSSHGVTVEVEGAPEKLQAFLDLLEQEKPPRSAIQGLETSGLTLWVTALSKFAPAILPARKWR